LPPSSLRYAEASLPTPAGSLTLVVYREAELRGVPEGAPAGLEREHLAIVAGSVNGLAGDDVLCRVHSECWTGETLHSLKCDCREQLDLAIAAIVEAGRGVVIYLRQEGRGIGLGNKVRAYALQQKGADTVEANLELGFAADLRSYDLAARILGDLGVRSVALMTNNPEKTEALEQAGVEVVRRVPHWGESHEHNRDYLAVKQKKLGHQT
jgi:GTP cyclohydrolase II/3,4-dihydroxy 2-butanone 4-phosphate synthase/GTP cyclohydrolase II